MKIRVLALPAVLVLLSIAAFAGEPASASAPAPSSITFDQVIDRVIGREAQFNHDVQSYSPLVETYIQNTKPDPELGSVPESDKYFLGRIKIDPWVEHDSYLQKPGLLARTFSPITKLVHADYLPRGFAQMIMVDNGAFDRGHYDFKYVRREFLGEVRCYVIDVSPRKHSGTGRFLGRIWVEDQGFSIVRFNGTYAPQPRGSRYLHFDSWRVNMAPNLWLPAYVYSEESDMKAGMFRDVDFKSQTRLWGYNVNHGDKQDEFTQISVDTTDSVKDQSENVQDLSPVASQRAWEHQAEDNVLERLQKAGLLAPEGEVDKVLQQVVNNIQITNNLDIQPEVRCRVLLTSPIETFSVGHTIVISRGLLDVLPDEASLAAVLAHELAHIALGHRFDTKYAFSDRMLFPDEATFKRFRFGRTENEENMADQKAVALLENSPYKDKLVSAGLFLRQLDARGKNLPQLVRARMGNPLLLKDQMRLNPLTTGTPALNERDVKQIAALPLGGRIKLDPWTNKIEISKNKPLALISAKEKMPLEVTPMFPYLTRIETGRGATNVASAQNATDNSGQTSAQKQ